MSLDFTDVDWYLVLAVSLGKSIVFFGTIAVVLLFSRKSIGLAGILAIFVSQTNDIALAFPVCTFLSVFQQIYWLYFHLFNFHSVRLLYPDLAKYIYLFAPTQLVILNPFGYFALEWHRTQEKAVVNSDTSLFISPPFHRTFFLTFRRILMVRSVPGRLLLHHLISAFWPRSFLMPVSCLFKVIRLVASNPLVFMTALGVIFNFILKHKLPDFVHVFFDDLGIPIFFLFISYSFTCFTLIGVLCVKVHLLVLRPSSTSASVWQENFELSNDAESMSSPSSSLARCKSCLTQC